MSLRLSGRATLQNNTNIIVCNVSTNLVTGVVVPVEIKKCDVMQQYGKSREVKLYIPQDSDRTFTFTDVNASTDYTGLTAATFDVWDTITSGSTNQISKSLSSGITLPTDDSLRVTIDNTDTAISAAKYHFELWVTTSAGERYLLKYGDFTVEDTRKFDV